MNATLSSELDTLLASRRDGYGMPRALYKTEALYEQELARIWHAGWLFAGFTCEIPNPGDFISLRVWTRDGEQEEIGILRRLEDWPIESQMLVRHALERRYFLQTIDGVESIRLELGHLHCDVRTPHGPKRFTMRWSQSQVQDFGDRGKMLLDLDDNRFLVPDVDALPPKERELFQRFVYW